MTTRRGYSGASGPRGTVEAAQSALACTPRPSRAQNAARSVMESQTAAALAVRGMACAKVAKVASTHFTRDTRHASLKRAVAHHPARAKGVNRQLARTGATTNGATGITSEGQSAGQTSAPTRSAAVAAIVTQPTHGISCFGGFTSPNAARHSRRRSTSMNKTGACSQASTSHCSRAQRPST